jgi:hypothetical protein
MLQKFCVVLFCILFLNSSFAAKLGYKSEGANLNQEIATLYPDLNKITDDSQNSYENFEKATADQKASPDEAGLMKAFFEDQVREDKAKAKTKIDSLKADTPNKVWLKKILEDAIKAQEAGTLKQRYFPKGKKFTSNPPSGTIYYHKDKYEEENKSGSGSSTASSAPLSTALPNFALDPVN